MKTLQFQVSFKEGFSTVSLLSDVNAISCHIQVDFNHNVVTVTNVYNTTFETVCRFVEKYCIINTLIIDNSFENSADVTIPSDITQKMPKDTDIHEKHPTKKVVPEPAIESVFGFAFEKLDKSKPLSEQITTFIQAIGLDTSELIVPAFTAACNMQKITYQNISQSISSELSSSNSDMNESAITKKLKKSFNDWLNKYPDMAEKCHTNKISLVTLLKAFAKKVS